MRSNQRIYASKKEGSSRKAQAQVIPAKMPVAGFAGFLVLWVH
jgi:hypothetical protein